MFATTTIEPRLIALLNDPAEVFGSSNLDLPPLQDLKTQQALSRLSPLEPQASVRRENPSSSLAVQQTLSFDRDIPQAQSATPGTNDAQISGASIDRTLGPSSPQSLRKILDNDADHVRMVVPPKKRQRIEAGKDDFVQLPEPPKKQKAAKQVVPPMIIGLFEPPPNAALFPPISSTFSHDSNERNWLSGASTEATSSLGSHSPTLHRQEQALESSSSKKRNVQARKKWTEVETRQLLLGVKKYGLGSWTKILQDSEFTFNGRKPVDLKDRFRTCCPAELRGSNKPDCSTPCQESEFVHLEGKNTVARLIENAGGDISSDEYNGEETKHSKAKKPPSSRAHRKNIEDLAQLGIKEPFQQSKRRERHPFSTAEDENILRGWEKYGASWTKIQKDPDLGLEARRPTDIRDRLRNRFPEKYKIQEDSQKATEEQPGSIPAHKNSLRFQNPPSISDQASLSSQDRALSQPQNLNESRYIPKTISSASSVGTGAKDIFSDLLEQPAPSDSLEPLSFSQSFDWSDGNIAPFTNSLAEMDISRFLSYEDNSTLSTVPIKPKQSYTDISSILSTTEAPSHQMFSGYGIQPYDQTHIGNLNTI